MEANELLVMARSVLIDAPRQLGADRTLAAALLVRQAMEAALDSWWATILPAMVDATDRAQQVTLPFYVGDTALAGDITWAWARLSATCHHHAYDLPPTNAEIESLIDVVNKFVELRAGLAPTCSNLTERESTP